MTDPVLTLLRRAKARIQNPDHWCTDDLARDARGLGTRPDSPEAVQWCARGALRASTANNAFNDTTREADDLLCSVARMAGVHHNKWNRIVTLNNVYGHAKVMGAFDWAIRMRELGLWPR